MPRLSSVKVPGGAVRVGWSDHGPQEVRVNGPARDAGQESRQSVPAACGEYRLLIPDAGSTTRGAVASGGSDGLLAVSEVELGEGFEFLVRRFLDSDEPVVGGGHGP